VQLYFLVTGPNEVVDDMGRRGVTAGAAKPFAAGQAFDNGAWIMDAAIPNSIILAL